MTLTQAAALKIYGCRRTLSGAFSKGRLKGKVVGRTVEVTKKQLNAWLKIKGKHKR